MVEKEIERIKKYTETLYGVKLPEIDIKYSNKLFGGLILGEEEELGIKINPKKYTIVLPTHKVIRVLSYKGYLRNARLEHKLEKEKREGPELEEVRTLKNLYSFLYDHPELYVCGTTWHEIGHVLAFSKNIFDDDLNEGVAMLYGFKGLLLGAQEGKFKINEIKEMMKCDIITFVAYPFYKEVFELVLGDFNLEFGSLEEALQDIERRIINTLKKETFNSFYRGLEVSISSLSPVGNAPNTVMHPSLPKLEG